MNADIPETGVSDYGRMRLDELQHGQENITLQIQDIHDVLVGNKFHPNGLVAKVGRLDIEVNELRKEWDRFKSLIGGLVLGAGMAGGGLGALISHFLGGGA